MNKMLKTLKLSNVGPAVEMEMTLGSRLNLITGDNGLGKTFLLDIAWWALTRSWPSDVNSHLVSDMMALPYESQSAKISFSFLATTKKQTYESNFTRSNWTWKVPVGRPANPGLVLYAMSDGSFAVWDPVRNYWKKQGKLQGFETPPAYVFSQSEIWNGQPGEGGKIICNGLLRDWANWQNARDSRAWDRLIKILNVLSPSKDEKIETGPLTRISPDDTRDIPTLKMSYGQNVPVLHASSGIRRIIAIAYALVWAWEEHCKASDLLHQKTAHQVTFLIDEIEAHLHPKWQRRVIPSLIKAMEELLVNENKREVQIIATTHSPLVMASAEPLFDAKLDCWFDLNLVSNGNKKDVKLTLQDFFKYGDASAWLTSNAFDLQNARSLEAEQVIQKAAKLMNESEENRNADIDKIHRINTELQGLLSDIDPFWIRWRYVAERRGWLK